MGHAQETAPRRIASAVFPDGRRCLVRRRVRGWSAEALKEARLAAGLTQEELAGRIRCAPSAVGNWEVGRSAPHPPLARAAADALGVPIGDLVRDLDPSEFTLRDLRDQAGLTLLEARTRLRLRYLGAMERGNMKVPDDAVAGLADLYGVDESTVLEAMRRS